jgi:hypothetical protein
MPLFRVIVKGSHTKQYGIQAHQKVSGKFVRDGAQQREKNVETMRPLDF